MPHSSEQEIAVLVHGNLELLCDIVLKALFAKWFESQLKKLRCYGMQKTFLLVSGLEIALTFVAYVQH